MSNSNLEPATTSSASNSTSSSTSDSDGFYVGYEDGEHMVIDYFDTIFEALAEFYLAIKEGPTYGTIEIELGECVNDDLEPLETHSFGGDETN